MESRIYIYPGWLRIWHFVNGILCILLIISGISMQYSGIDDVIMEFGTAVKMHNISGVALTAFYALFFFGNMFTWNGRQYWLYRKGVFSNMYRQFIYYTIGVFKNANAPFPITRDNKFNPLQRFVYFIVGYIMLIVVILTGWAYLFPEFVPSTVFGVSGLMINDLLHIFAGFIISIFLFIHVYFCTMGNKKMKNFMGMINGFHTH
jgi:thiosulfate reductase cytochrome b subunit